MMRANVMNTYVDGDSDSDAMRTSRTDRSIDHVDLAAWELERDDAIGRVSGHARMRRDAG